MTLLFGQLDLVPELSPDDYIISIILYNDISMNKIIRRVSESTEHVSGDVS